MYCQSILKYLIVLGMYNFVCTLRSMYAARSPHLSLSEMFRKNCLSLIASTVISPRNICCVKESRMILVTVKVNRLEFRFMVSLQNKASLRNLNFYAHSVRLLRKLNHVLLWILQCWTVGRSSTAVAEDLRPTATVAEV